MKKTVIAFLTIMLMVSAIALMACEAIEDSVNEATKQTKTIEMTITDDWVPLLAVRATIGQNTYELNTVCYAQPFSFDTLIEASSYADWWDDIKTHIDEVIINDLLYRLRRNISDTNGAIRLYLIGSDDIPDPIEIQGYGLDDILDDPSIPLIFVDPVDLSDSDLIARIPVDPGVNVDDWTAVEWFEGGESRVEDQLISFDESFSFCMELNVTPVVINDIGDFDNIDPIAEMKMRTNLDVVFVPL